MSIFLYVLRTKDISNLHLVNGCRSGDYTHRNPNVVMEQNCRLCKAANLLVESESSSCFNDRTNKLMDLVVRLDNTDVLIDVTTVDSNNPSNGFVKESEITLSYFPGAAAVMKARSKFRKYKKVIAASKEFVPFVIETQGR